MKKIKVLFWDIETSPNLAYVWGKWEQNVIGFEKEWELLSVAYKWQGEKKVHCLTKRGRSEKALVKDLWDLFDQADVLIAHNGDKFDTKKAKAKFMEHQLPPPSPFKSIDTLKLARSQFAFNSNKLDDLGEILKIGRKVPTGGFSTWLGCMANDKRAWNKMIKYNKRDVVLLEGVYKRLRAWAPNHPNFAILDPTKSACPVCSSHDIQNRGARYVHSKRYHCKSCGHWFTIRAKKVL